MRTHALTGTATLYAGRRQVFVWAGKGADLGHGLKPWWHAVAPPSKQWTAEARRRPRPPSVVKLVWQYPMSKVGKDVILNQSWFHPAHSESSS